jgi:purine-binding chemotaxis protein CheW
MIDAVQHQPSRAARPQRKCDPESENQYVSFWIEDQLLGVLVNAVQEVLNPQVIAKTPKSRPEVAGLLNLRGQIVTAVDMRRRLNLPPAPGPAMNVVVRHKGESFSLLVDEVGDVIRIAADRMDAVPQTLERHWKGVTSGVFRLEDRLLTILDVSAILRL